MNVNYDSNENIWEATVTITFPCKQSIKKHDMNKFDLAQFEYRIRNLVTLYTSGEKLNVFFLPLSF